MSRGGREEERGLSFSTLEAKGRDRDMCICGNLNDSCRYILLYFLEI